VKRILALTLVLASVMALAEENKPGAGEATQTDSSSEVQPAIAKLWETILRSGDSDNSGRLSKEEVLALPWQELRNVQGSFKTIDGNRDGNIDRQEFIQWKKRYGVSRRDLFAACDRDGDASLSMAEVDQCDDPRMENLKEHFAEIDSNHNGGVTPQEWMTFLIQNQQHKGAAEGVVEKPENGRQGSESAPSASGK